MFINKFIHFFMYAFKGAFSQHVFYEYLLFASTVPGATATVVNKEDIAWPH